jgi:pimeloyl-ACP methyl ester carboxylesterase
MRGSWRLALGGVMAIVALAGVAGCVYEQRAEAADARRFPPPGRLVDAGGRRLHVVCIGDGSPVVLFEPSGFGNSLSFWEAREALARRLRVCSYDRAGAGWSDPGPDPLSIGTLAGDALRVLDGVSPGAPAVVVASSVGGFTAELLARRHPERVAALVLLDAGSSALLTDVERLVPWGRLKVGCMAVPAAGRLGLIRLADPFDIEPSASEARARSAAVTYRPGVWETLCAIVHGFARTRDEFARAPALRSDLPLVVLSAESPRGLVPPLFDSSVVSDLQPLMQKAHRSLAAHSSRGNWRIVPGSDHLIAGSRPQAVVDAVYDVITPSR